jgi:hypothetical protein
MDSFKIIRTEAILSRKDIRLVVKNQLLYLCASVVNYLKQNREKASGSNWSLD